MPAQAPACFPSPDTSEEPGAEARQFRERKVKQAMAFLREVFADAQARPASEIVAAAQARDIRPTTLHDAKERLHITSKRQGQQWIWVPPKPRQARRKHPTSHA